MSFVTITRKNLVIQGIVFLLLGILFVAFPDKILKGISIYLGIVMLVPGVVMIVTPLARREGAASPALLTEGVLLTLFGLLFIFRPELVGKLLALFVGIWMIGAGIMQVAGSAAKKSMGWKYWWTQFLAGVLLLIAGIVILFNAFSVSVALMIWFGVIMIIFGVYYLVLAFTQY
jgi:uncharacterized membrane protein HdeD (DUF308 family)